MATTSLDETKEISLLEFLDLSQLNCLNESIDHPLKDLLADKRKNSNKSKYLLSDADEQLLLSLHFNQAVRVRAIVIEGSIRSQAPRLIKLLVNHPSIGFEDVEDAEEPEVAQVLELDEEKVTTGQPVALRFVRFQNVNSLHIFIASNQGGESETRVDAVDICGTPINATKDLSGLKRTED